MLDKNASRLRRARQTRLRIRDNGALRLTVYRTNSHIYAQIITSGGDKVLAAASTAEKEVRAQLKNGANRKAADVGGAAPRRPRGRHRDVRVDRAGYRYRRVKRSPRLPARGA